MRFVGLLLRVFGQTSFMTDYTTTMGTTVYTPSNWPLFAPEQQAEILRHERVHMRQARRLTRPLFSFLYAMIPLPLGLSYFRARFEMEAYAESIAARYEYGLSLGADERARFISYFTTGAYLWMWPFSAAIGAWYDKTVLAVTSGK